MVPSSSEGSQESSTQMNAVLAEFNAIRAEILFRATSQATLIQINITAVATIVGFVFANQANPLILVIIPILSPVLGMLWLDHDASIAWLGNFIKMEIKVKYNTISAFDYPDYQTYMDCASDSNVVTLNFNIAIVITFFVLPVAVLVFALATVGSLTALIFSCSIITCNSTVAFVFLPVR